jgi:hypothetical protein
MDDDEDELDREADREVLRFEEALEMFLEPLRAQAQGRRRERIDRAADDLRRCLEANAQRLLTTPELDLLPLEQQLDPVGAVARVASADVLLLLLRIFVEDVEWHGIDAEDRRIRLHLTMALTRQVARLPQLAGYAIGCEVWSIEGAVERARADLRRSRRAPELR